jgi:uncharacterized protein
MSTIESDVRAVGGAAPPHPAVERETARDGIDAAVARATRRMAPVWPLRHWVAVNPFLGVADRPFDEAARCMARVAGARMTMPRGFYAEAIRSGRITDADLAAALAEALPGDGVPWDVAGLRAAALAGGDAPAPAPLPTVADAAARVTGLDWPSYVAERISGWAARHWDEGQSLWRSPWRGLSPFAAWRAEACIDRAPEVMGVAGFRALAARLPSSAAAAAAASIERLGVPADGLDEYLHRLLMSVGGWAAYARYRVWESELHGAEDGTLAELLAVRLAWEVALLDAFAGAGVEAAWAGARAAYGADDDTRAGGPDAIDLALHAAYEKGWQRDLLDRLHAPRAKQPPQRTLVQAAFCIDVRSEIFRRALERVDPRTQTVGFAGFFGFPLEYVPLGHERGGAQCPVLLTPQFVVAEGLRGADDAERAEVSEVRLLRRRVANAWKAFKSAAVSSFAFVGPVGLAWLPKLVTDTLGLTRTVEHPSADRLDLRNHGRRMPDLEPREIGGRGVGMDHAQRLDMAEAVLRAMSMTDGFARIVVLAGHGSTTVNNPHATGLDCGACGGHTGEANARVAAAVLNDPAARFGLVDRGIVVPDDTLFVAALHDTTTDEVTLFDVDDAPAGHAADLARLRDRLAAAAALARAERAHLLGIGAGADVDDAVLARSRDWSQVRPEWGLAGCAAFIAAPRHRTEGVDLGGRAFLHSYDWRQDREFGVLELILTAPVVVASWISLQYFGSAVDNRVFGSGNKTLHNVVGGVGVLEGNGGDLRVGLPWQSVHDGERLVHEPVRLSVVIEAPTEAMNEVIARHEGLRHLLDNGWLHLFAMDDAGAIALRYTGALQWEPVDLATSRRAA